MSIRPVSLRVPLTSRSRLTVATCLANGVEWYDYAVYGAMAAVLVRVLFPPGAGDGGLVAVFAVFASSFLARPLGAVLVGLRADRVGRRRALAATVLLMTASTAAVGVLPTWSAVGMAAPISLLLLRLLQGFSSGGGIITSTSYLVESVPRTRWGRYTGWHTGTIAVGVAMGIGVAGTMNAILSREDLEAWGWRIPFLLALPMGLIGLRLRLVSDDATAPIAPLRKGEILALLRSTHLAAARTGIALAAALAGTFNMWFIYLPVHFASGQHHMSVTLTCSAIGLLVAAGCAPALGALSDHVGRRPLLVSATTALGLSITPLFLLASHGSSAGLLVADVMVGVMLAGLVVSAQLADSFPVEVRTTGFAATYGVATAVIGGTAPLVGSVLTAAGAAGAIPGYLVLLAGVALLFALRLPSRRVATTRG
jgi:MHS family proline/betaine transporter-like MFS transporter